MGSQEIKCRMEKARVVFDKINIIFQSHNIKFYIKMRFMRRCVFSDLFYGVEAQTFTKATSRKPWRCGYTAEY